MVFISRFLTGSGPEQSNQLVSRGTGDKVQGALPFRPHGNNSRGRIRTCISRVSSEVTLVFTTGQVSFPVLGSQLPVRGQECPHYTNFAGERARRVDSRRDISWYLVHRGYAPVPGALILGRIAILRVFVRGEVSLLFHHRRKPRSQLAGARLQQGPRLSCYLRTATCQLNFWSGYRWTRLGLRPGGFEPPTPQRGLPHEVSVAFRHRPCEKLNRDRTSRHARSYRHATQMPQASRVMELSLLQERRRLTN